MPLDSQGLELSVCPALLACELTSCELQNSIGGLLVSKPLVPGSQVLMASSYRYPLGSSRSELVPEKQAFWGEHMEKSPKQNQGSLASCSVCHCQEPANHPPPQFLSLSVSQSLSTDKCPPKGMRCELALGTWPSRRQRPASFPSL